VHQRSVGTEAHRVQLARSTRCNPKTRTEPTTEVGVRQPGPAEGRRNTLDSGSVVANDHGVQAPIAAVEGDARSL
jgi:hypothetical protein